MSSHVWEEGQCSYVETKGEAWSRWVSAWRDEDVTT